MGPRCTSRRVDLRTGTLLGQEWKKVRVSLTPWADLALEQELVFPHHGHKESMRTPQSRHSICTQDGLHLQSSQPRRWSHRLGPRSCAQTEVLGRCIPGPLKAMMETKAKAEAEVVARVVLLVAVVVELVGQLRRGTGDHPLVGSQKPRPTSWGTAHGRIAYQGCSGPETA